MDTEVSALSLASLSKDVNVLFLAWASSLVLFMQAGFAIFESGHVHVKKLKTTVLKNMLENCIGAVAWLVLGHAIATGAGGAAFTTNVTPSISQSEGSPEELSSLLWVFQYTFASTASTIVSGAIAERTQLRSHLIFSFATFLWIFPVARYWMWGKSGWLSSSLGNGVFDLGAVDVAGSGVVHVLGGTSAIVGAYITGPRLARCSPPSTSSGASAASAGGVACTDVVQSPHPPHPLGSSTSSGSNSFRLQSLPTPSATLVSLGAFIIWFTFYGFNLGSLGGVVGRGEAAGHAAATTTLSAAIGGAVVLLLTLIDPSQPFCVSAVSNGMISGLVSIASGCSVVDFWAVPIIASFASGLALYAGRLLESVAGVDDTVGAGATHLVGGSIGMLGTGLFARDDLLRGYLNRAPPDFGLFVGGKGRLLGMQLLATFVLTAWAASHAAVIYSLLRSVGWLRLDRAVEQSGMDSDIFERKQHRGSTAISLIRRARMLDQDMAKESPQQGRVRLVGGHA